MHMRLEYEIINKFVDTGITHKVKNNVALLVTYWFNDKVL